MALQILDDAVQAHGGAGVSGDFNLASIWAGVRTLRLADGPDEVHLRAIARNEFRKYAEPKNAGVSSGDIGVSRLAGV
jgi:acyl-CoA dehydrogenase